MTNILLTLILLAFLAKIGIDWRNTQRFAECLDSLAEMLGDMLRELIDSTKGKE